MTLTLQLAAIVHAAVVLRLFGVRDRAWCAGLLLVLLVWSWVPYPWGVPAWISSYTGQFSMATILLAATALAVRLGWPVGPGRRELRAFAALVLLVAAVFYPLSLGAAPVNPYEWGFGSYPLSSALLGLGLLAWLLRAWFLLTVLVLAQFALALSLQASDNLWDYLLDPWLAFWALGWLVRDAWQHRPRVQASE